MRTDKIQLTIPNNLYGDKVVTAYECNGLAVAKLGKTWTVYQVVSGATINGRYQVATRREALDAMHKLIELVKWSSVWQKPLEHRDMRELFDAHRDEIRAILS